jgi:hypothetical protein
MRALLAAAWLRPVPTPGGWDFLPVVCAGVLLLSTRAAGVRLRWWGWLAAVAAGLPCAALASRFGPWALVAVATAVFLVAVPAARASRRD